MKSVLESRLWQLVKPHLFGHTERVENLAGTGTPDVDNCNNGKTVRIELKVERRKTLVLLDLFEKSQPIWHRKRVAAGGIVLVLVRHGEALLLFRPKVIGRAICYLPVWDCSGKPYDWHGFEKYIAEVQ